MGGGIFIICASWCVLEEKLNSRRQETSVSLISYCSEDGSYLKVIT